MGLNLFYKAITNVRVKASKTRTLELEQILPPREDSTKLARGYRELSKNRTLAGRGAARHFNGEDRDDSPNRLRMVSRLRDKEKFLIWRHIMQDLGRYVLGGFNKYNPASLIADPTTDAIRRR